MNTFISDRIAVSVIVPIYNVEDYLVQCLDSILSQTLNNIEIICINDGSTDNCLQVLEEYAAKDARIKVVNQGNRGYGSAVNKGIQEAKGEYIGIVEPDDYILPNMYETLYSVATKNGCEIVKSDFYRFIGGGNTFEKTYCMIAKEKENYNRVINPKEEKGCFRFVMNTWCGIYKRKFILSNNINHNETSGASFQDNGFWFKGFCYAERILFVDKAFYMNRRDNPKSSVYCRQKVYCGNIEYGLIYDFLCQNIGLKDKFTDVFMMKKWHTYMFNLRRIGSQFRHEYIQKISKEFAESYAKGELSKAVFTSDEWTELMQIIRDPEEYFYINEQERVKISVVLPVYNCREYLCQCLDSLVFQTMQEIEIICVDDGATDGSGEILNQYAKKDSRITVIKTENKGAGAARNIGLKVACGKYLSFLDSDDWFEPHMLEAAYEKAEQDKADITIFRSMQYDNETGQMNPCIYSLKLDQLPVKRPFSVNDMECSVFRNLMGWAWDKLYRRSFVLNNELLFQEQRTTNDMYFTYISLYKASRITTCDQFLYYQRRNIKTSLSATRENSWKCFYFALGEIKRELKEMGIWNKYCFHFVDYALHSCLWNLNSLDENQGLELFDNLKQEWFRELDIVDAPVEWFAYQEEYRQFQEIMNPDSNYHTYKTTKCGFENGEFKMQLMEQLKMLEKDVLMKSQEAESWRYQLEETRKSLSFRIGRAVTWLPRKIRGW